MPAVYLLHFEPRFKHAGHYVGYIGRDEVQARLEEHQNGEGSRLTRHAVRAGCVMVLARVWLDAPRKFELKIKGRGLAPICPICTPQPPQPQKGRSP